MSNTVRVSARRALDYQGVAYRPGDVFLATPRDVLVLAHAKQISLTRPARSVALTQPAPKPTRPKGSDDQARQRPSSARPPSAPPSITPPAPLPAPVSRPATRRRDPVGDDD